MAAASTAVPAHFRRSIATAASSACRGPFSHATRPTPICASDFAHSWQGNKVTYRVEPRKSDNRPR